MTDARTPYSVDPNILLTASEMVQANNFAAPARFVYSRVVAEAVEYLNMIGTADARKHEAAFTRVLAMMTRTGALAVAVGPADAAPAAEAAAARIRELDTQFTAEAAGTAMGEEFLALSAEVFAAKHAIVRDAIQTLYRIAGSMHTCELFTAPSMALYYNEVVGGVTAFYRYMITAGQTNINMRDRFAAINKKYSRRLFEAMLYVSVCYRTSDDPIRASAIFNAVVADIFPLVHGIIDVMQEKRIAERLVPVPRFLDAIHTKDEANILSMNASLLRYLKDMGLTDVEPAPAVEEAAVMDARFDTLDRAGGTGAALARLRQYSSDMYRVYKIIVRDVVLYQFRSATRDMPEAVALEWAAAQLPPYEEFLNKLLFFDVAQYLGADVAEYTALTRVLDRGASAVFSDCTMQRALGATAYAAFLRECALDSMAGHVQCRTETLLLAIASRDLGTVARERVGESREYAALMTMLDAVAQHMQDMSAVIITVFNLINIHRTEFVTEQQFKNSDVVTFVKIRNDQENVGNRRFDITLDSNATTMLIRYEDNEARLYGTSAETPIAPTAKAKAAPPAKATLLSRSSKPATRFGRGGALTKQKKVANPTNVNKAGPIVPREAGSRGPETTYMFGPFTRIYRPMEGPNEIAGTGIGRETTEYTIVNRLRAGKNVCIFGYGQSGSGKTSLLIYYKKNPDDSGDMGIMSLMADKLSDSYDSVECEIREIGILRAGETVARVRGGTDTPFYASKRFVWGRPEHPQYAGAPAWIMASDDYAALPLLPKVGRPNEAINRQMLQMLGSYVFFATENNRLTEATTNNPVSSRSHIFVFCRFRRGAEVGPTMVIGDFAGVENKFDCGNTDVLKAFAEIKFDNRDEFAYERVINSGFESLVRPALVGARIAATDLTTASFSDVSRMYSDKVISDKTARLEAFANALKTEAESHIPTKPFSTSRMYQVIRAIVELQQMPIDLTVVSSGIDDKPHDVAIFKRFYANETGVYSVPRFLSSYDENAFKQFTASEVRRDIIRAWLGNPKKTSFGDIETAKALMELRNTTTPVQEIGGLDAMLFYILRAASQLSMGEACASRVAEGIYINDSLDVFRRFLSRNLRNSGAVPKIHSECGALQCNPMYTDCFGSLYDMTADTIGAVETVLVEMLGTPGNAVDIAADSKLDPSARYMLAQRVLADLTFCVFNVINISRNRNDPPPVPFIDASPVIYEYNRSMSNTNYKKYTPNHNIDMFDAQTLENLKHRTTAHTTLDKTIKIALTTVIETAVQALSEFERPIALAKVKIVMDEFDKINAPTFMGTMIFTDSLAKFGVNRAMCVLDSTAYNTDFLNNLVFKRLKTLLGSAKNIANNLVL
jgi:hypothetical protein